MTDDDIERQLGRFRVSDPPDARKASVLRTVKRRRRYSDARMGWAIAAAVFVACLLQARAENGARERRIEAALHRLSVEERAAVQMLGPQAARYLALSRALVEEQTGDVREVMRSELRRPGAAENLPW